MNIALVLLVLIVLLFSGLFWWLYKKAIDQGLKLIALTGMYVTLATGFTILVIMLSYCLE